MKCNKVLSLIEDYHYGELDGRISARIALHLRACHACSASLDALDRESRTYLAYAEDVEGSLDVTPAMWQLVHARVGEMSQRASLQPSWRAGVREKLGALRDFFSWPKPMRYLGFATLLLLLAIGAGVFKIYFKGANDQKVSGVTDLKRSEEATGPQEKESAANVSNLPRDARQKSSVQIALLSIQRAERDYIEAIRVLSAAVNERKKVDPQLEGALGQDLRLIDQTIAATRRAYQAHPHDFDLAQYMLTAYARKVEVLQQLAS